MVQRAELLDAIQTDLYGARRLLARRAIPAAAVLDHEEYLRNVVGIGGLGGQRLFMIAADLGRDPSGQWKVISDRTQAPSGAGLRHAEPAGDLPGASRPLPPGESAPADAVLPGDAAGPGRRRAEHGRGSPGRRAQPGHPLRDGVRPGLRRLAAGLPAAGGPRPHRPRRPGLDAGAGPARAGRRDPAPGRLDLDGRAGAPAGVAAGRDRSAGVRTPGHGQRGERHRLRDSGEPGPAAVPARAVRAAARSAAAAAVGGHLVVR